MVADHMASMIRKLIMTDAGAQFAFFFSFLTPVHGMALPTFRLSLSLHLT